MLALSLNALGTLPVAPISWSHHWVWAVPILVTFGVIAWPTRIMLAVSLTACGLLLFVLWSQRWWDPAHEWDAARLLTGNLYVCYAATAVALGSRLVRLPGFLCVACVPAQARVPRWMVAGCRHVPLR